MQKWEDFSSAEAVLVEKLDILWDRNWNIVVSPISALSNNPNVMVPLSFYIYIRLRSSGGGSEDSNILKHAGYSACLKDVDNFLRNAKKW